MSFLRRVIKVFGIAASEQEDKGIQKYGKELDPLDHYDWLQMAQEELVDGFKYFEAERQKRNYRIAETLNLIEIGLSEAHGSAHDALEAAKQSLLTLTKDVRKDPITKMWNNQTYFTEELREEAAAAMEEGFPIDWLSPLEQKELNTVSEFTTRNVYNVMIVYMKKHADRLGFFSMTLEQMMEAGTIKNRSRLRALIQDLENKGKVKVIAEGRTSRYMLPEINKLKGKSE